MQTPDLKPEVVSCPGCMGRFSVLDPDGSDTTSDVRFCPWCGDELG